MIEHYLGYELYKLACEHFQIQPLNLHYFILQLSDEQLLAYNNYAYEKRGLYGRQNETNTA